MSPSPSLSVNEGSIKSRKRFLKIVKNHQFLPISGRAVGDPPAHRILKAAIRSLSAQPNLLVAPAAALKSQTILGRGCVYRAAKM
jgi:hypothetical protein